MLIAINALVHTTHLENGDELRDPDAAELARPLLRAFCISKSLPGSAPFARQASGAAQLQVTYIPTLPGSPSGQSMIMALRP